MRQEQGFIQGRNPERELIKVRSVIWPSTNVRYGNVRIAFQRSGIRALARRQISVCSNMARDSSQVVRLV